MAIKVMIYIVIVLLLSGILGKAAAQNKYFDSIFSFVLIIVFMVLILSELFISFKGG